MQTYSNLKHPPTWRRDDRERLIILAVPPSVSLFQSQFQSQPSPPSLEPFEFECNPITQQPTKLPSLPPELHHLILQHLHPIDRTCFALASKRLCASVLSAPRIRPRDFVHWHPGGVTYSVRSAEQRKNGHQVQWQGQQQLEHETEDAETLRLPPPEHHALILRLADGWMARDRWRYCRRCGVIKDREEERWRGRCGFLSGEWCWWKRSWRQQQQHEGAKRWRIGSEEAREGGRLWALAALALKTKLKTRRSHRKMAVFVPGLGIERACWEGMGWRDRAEVMVRAWCGTEIRRGTSVGSTSGGGGCVCCQQQQGRSSSWGWLGLGMPRSSSKGQQSVTATAGGGVQVMPQQDAAEADEVARASARAMEEVDVPCPRCACFFQGAIVTRPRLGVWATLKTWKRAWASRAARSRLRAGVGGPGGGFTVPVVVRRRRTCGGASFMAMVASVRSNLKLFDVGIGGGVGRRVKGWWDTVRARVSS